MRSGVLAAVVLLVGAAGCTSGSSPEPDPPTSATLSPTTSTSSPAATHVIVFEASTDNGVASIVWSTEGEDQSGEGLTREPTPWTTTFRTPSDPRRALVSVNGLDGSDTASCRITVDGVVRAEQSVTRVSVNELASAICRVT